MEQHITQSLFYLLLLLPGFVTGFTIHEFAHAWADTKLGDDTAQRQGRLTLDPVAHIDPMGFLVIIVAVLFRLPLIGWAKPVPFNARNYANPRRDTILSAIAGPISNVIQAFCWLLSLLLFRLIAAHAGVHFSKETAFDIINRVPDMASIPQIVATIMVAAITVNVTMAVFNMIPIPPLDGHWVLEGLGPPFVTEVYNAIRAQPFISYMLLIFLLQTPFLGQAMAPFYDWAYRGVFLAFGLPADLI